tara:strand:+ start:6736 stop:7827 length:1092 start_codon:yes stop_codon:yes gene_type:complete
MKLEQLDTPVLVVDEDAFLRNMKRMQEIAAGAGIAYRPHAKAHKSPEITKMQLDAGAVGVCCAKLGEAEVLASHDIKDILITTPVIGISKLTRMMQIANKAKISVVADNPDNIAEMAAVAQTCGVRPDVVLEVDVGQGRCGLPPGDPVLELAYEVMNADWLNFKGLQGYQGAIQMTASFAERDAAARKAVGLLTETADLIRSAGLPLDYLTGGGSGTSVIDAASAGLTELQPGGYLFMDSRYREIEWDDGNSIPFEQSLTLMASVISLPEPGRCILDMGLKAISTDGGPPAPIDMPGAEFKFAGEEHSELTFANGNCPLKLGDKVTFVPTHCDTTVNLYDRFVAYSGDEVVDVWNITARGRVQ